MLVASSVEPVRSANTTVTTLRSSGVRPAVGGGPGIAGIPNGVPHRPQKRNDEAQVAAHDGHVRSSDVPHDPQNRWSGDVGAPQLGQGS